MQFEERDCIKQYILLREFENGNIEIENPKNEKFLLSIMIYHKNDEVSFSDLQKTYKFYQGMKKLQFCDINVIDYCVMDSLYFEKNYMKRYPKLLKHYKDEDLLHDDSLILLLIFKYKENITKRISQFGKIINIYNLFELYYNLFLLKYNYNIIINEINTESINIEKYDSTRKEEKYNENINYLICDCLFINTKIENRILLNSSNLVDYESNKYSLAIDIYEDIKDVKNDILNLDSYLISSLDKECVKLYNFIYKNSDKSAIDILFEMAKMIFSSECKKITDKEKKEIKNLHIINCEEKRSLDLTTYIPPIEAYEQKERKFPRFIHTGRPKSYMIQMCKKIIEDEKEKELCFKDNLFLPIIRYQGLYHPESEKKKYCGTFYYIEPESTVLLNLGKCSVFSTKVHAYIALKAKLENKSREEILNEVFDISFGSDMNINIWEKTKQYLEINNEKLKDLMIEFYIPLLHNENDVKKISLINTTQLYPTDESEIWGNYKDDKPIKIALGIHDDFDGDICKMARELKIDTLLLQHEIGETRAVTEILDTRIDSYDNLVRISGDKKEWYKVSKKYPTIWFLDNGFITNMKCKKIDIDREDVNLVKCE